MEQHTAQLITQFLASDRGASAQTTFVNALALALSEAHDMGVQIAQGMVARGVAIAHTGLFQRFMVRSREIMNGILERVRALGASVVPDSLASMISTTEVVTVLEKTIMETLDAAQVRMVEWSASPDACSICLENSAQGPIRIYSKFESGNACPPAHVRCRCGIMPVYDVEGK